MTTNKAKNQKGALLIYLIIFIGVFAMVMVPVVGTFIGKIQLLRLTIMREQAFQIAEAGINYYQWHMVAFPGDFQDGTDQAGPYIHDYIDYDIPGTQKIGQFSLTITPPQMGSSSIVVSSTGWTDENPNVKRTITATYGVSSLASYALLTHSWIYAWNSESYNGPIHSDTGIRFEGNTQSIITSSVASTYMSDCNQEYPENPDCNQQVSRPAIWATGANQGQSSVYWSNPATTADFTGISTSFSTIAEQSQSPENISLPNNTNGYSLVFNSNGTVSVYKVLSTINTGSRFPVIKALSDGTNTGLGYINGGTDYKTGICNNANCNNCGNNGRCFLYTKTIGPDGMVISSINNLWAEGTVKGRVTVAASNPSAVNTNPNASNITTSLMPNIYIPGNLRYSTNESGSGSSADTIGLMSQGSIVVTKNAPDTTYINGALLAQKGFIAFPICYSGSDRAKTNLYIFGSMIMNGSWWFNFTNYCGSSFTDGFLHPNFSWDPNLLYYPPPYFPSSSVSSSLQLSKWVTN
jgi:hypothetical protein